jgi:isopenicillin N synthase-like dioxygenase
LLAAHTARSTDGGSSIPPDPVESYTCNRRSFLDIMGIGLSSSLGARLKLSFEYFVAMESLLDTLHQIAASALNLSDLNFFEEYYSRISKTSGNALRFAHYPPSNETAEATVDEHGEVREDSLSKYGAHTDYQGFTILLPDKDDWTTPDHGGLEIQLPETGRWIQANLSSHRVTRLSGEILVVNSGDLIQRWTNDYWRSTVHRVAGSKPGSLPSKRSRRSIVFFSGPSDDAVVSNLPLDYLGKPKYAPIQSGEHLKMKIDRTHV